MDKAVDLSHPTCGPTSARIVEAARDLRQDPTRAEALLWSQLRGRRLGGFKFRRQHPYEGFVLDAYCVEARLAVEVDGAVHQGQEQAALDRERQEFLESKGIAVVRFRNDEVLTDLPSVLAQLLARTQQRRSTTGRL